MEQQAFNETLDKFLAQGSVKASFGEPQQVGEKTLITVAQVTLGYGAGSGRGPRMGGEGDAAATQPGGAGAGGGLRVKPLAVVEVTATETKIRPVTDSTRIALTALALAAWNVFWIAATLRAIFGKRFWERKGR